MKAILWGGVALLALLWTSGAALLSKAVKWSAQQMSAGSMTSLDGLATTNIVIPVWLTPWFDPVAWTNTLQVFEDILENFSSVLPSMWMVVGWLVPAIWITWIFGMLILLMGVVIGTMMLRRLHSA